MFDFDTVILTTLHKYSNSKSVLNTLLETYLLFVYSCRLDYKITTHKMVLLNIKYYLKWPSSRVKTKEIFLLRNFTSVGRVHSLISVKMYQIKQCRLLCQWNEKIFLYIGNCFEYNYTRIFCFSHTHPKETLYGSQILCYFSRCARVWIVLISLKNVFPGHTFLRVIVSLLFVYIGYLLFVRVCSFVSLSGRL